MQSYFIQFLNLVSHISKKKVIYLSGNYSNENNLAVKTKFGFWYCGNVFEYSDIAHGFANNGTIEDNDLTLVETIIKYYKEDTSFIFYDIGSNTGPYTLLATSTHPSLQTHSFDPVKEHLVTLNESILLNRFEQRVTTHEIGLSNANKEETIYLAGSGSTVEKEFINEGTPKRQIKLRVLDDYIEEKNLPLPSFIKIDVEGHEYHTLQGCQKTLEKSSPILFIEIAKSLTNIGRDFVHKDFDAIFEMLEKNKYRAFTLDGTTLTKKDTLTTPDGVHMYLFLHQEKHLNDKGLTQLLNLN